MRRYESIFIEHKNDFWWCELVNEVGVQKIYVNCIYKERDDWNRIKVEIDDLAYCEGNLVPVSELEMKLSLRKNHVKMSASFRIRILRQSYMETIYIATVKRGANG